MSNIISEKPTSASEVEAQKVEPVYDDEKVDYNRSGAIDAENLEHKMGVWEAVKAYPAASWWAFVMSCTIVSVPLPIEAFPIPCLWSPLAYTSPP